VVVSAAVVVVAVVENRTGGAIVSHKFLEAEAGEDGSVVLGQSCMEDTELQAVVGIEEDGEGSAGEDEVWAAVEQDASVVPAQGEPDIVLLAGWESEGPVQSVEEQSGEEQSDVLSGVSAVEEPGVLSVEEQSDEEPGVQSVEEQSDEEPDVQSVEKQSDEEPVVQSVEDYAEYALELDVDNRTARVVDVVPSEHVDVDEPDNIEPQADAVD
jgi:hypothetical protein